MLVKPITSTLPHGVSQRVPRIGLDEITEVFRRSLLLVCIGNPLHACAHLFNRTAPVLLAEVQVQRTRARLRRRFQVCHRIGRYQG